MRLALEAAAPLREELQRRGVFVVPLPIYPDEPGEQQAELPALTPEVKATTGCQDNTAIP